MELVTKVDGHAAETAQNFAQLREDNAQQSDRVKQLCADISGLGASVATVQSDLLTVKGEVDELSTSSALLASTQRSHSEQIQQLQQQYKTLASQVTKQATDVAACQSQQNEAAEQRNRESRNFEVMLRGIPLSGGEKQHELESKLITLAKAIDLPLTPADIEEAHIIRTRHDRSTRPTMMVVVRFASLRLRRSFFHHYIKKPASFSTKALNEPTNERIYASDNLTRKNAEIRRAAGKLKKEGKIHSYTIYKGEVSVVVSEGLRHQRVHSMSELSDIVAGLADINNTLENMEV